MNNEILKDIFCNIYFKGMMSESNFLGTLMNMDVDAISNAQVRQIKGFLRGIGVSLQEMKSISNAGAGMMKFVEAVMGYCEVAREIKPKREKVAKLEKGFFIMKKDLAQAKKDLAEVQHTLAELQKQFEEAMTEKTELETEAAIMERRLIAADKLIGGLGSERARWKIELAALKERKIKLLGDCLLGAAFLSYQGAFNYDFRHDMVFGKFIVDIAEKGIPISDPFKLG